MLENDAFDPSRFGFRISLECFRTRSKTMATMCCTQPLHLGPWRHVLCPFFFQLRRREIFPQPLRQGLLIQQPLLHGLQQEPVPMVAIAAIASAGRRHIQSNTLQEKE